MARPVVAIVGRPNVGKSTLFNRIIGDKRAIVEDSPGTTRDLNYADTTWKGHDITLVDSGGLEPKPESRIKQGVRKQVQSIINTADVILFIVDAREGLLPDDLDVVDLLRRSQKPVILVANKIDNVRQENLLHQFYEIGLGDPIPVSAYHGKGAEDILDRVIHLLPDRPSETEVENLPKIAIVGRPNVGKSMLVNTLLGKERVIVDDTPGTTRDAIDSLLVYGNERVILIDTAGLRRRGKIEQGVEQFSMMRSMRAIERSDIALILIDALEGVAAQDTHVLGYVKEAFKGAILVVNKWDAVENKDQEEWIEAIREKIKFMPYIDILFISAKTGYGVDKILPAVREIYNERFKHLSNSAMNRFIKEAAADHLPPKKGYQLMRFISARQTGVNPPTFVFVVNDAKLAHFSYQRYLENRLRDRFGFKGNPLRLIFKGRSEKASLKQPDIYTAGSEFEDD